MKKILLPIVIAFLIMKCTSNPVGDDGISGSKNRLEGNVVLDNFNQPERVYIWLEDFGLGAYSKTDGSFSLSIPPGLNSNVNGFFKLYFYVANYQLSSVEVAIRNGEFVPNEGALGKNGKLRQDIELAQFLEINTQVTPRSVASSYAGNVEIEASFQTVVQDTATIVIPNSVEQFLGPVFFKNTSTGQTQVFTGIPLENNAKIVVGNSPISKSITFGFNNLGLSPGTYKVMPFVYIRHQEVPRALLNSIDQNIELLGNYLKIPLSFKGGDFEIR